LCGCKTFILYTHMGDEYYNMACGK
jgi:hypothetical protein